MRTWYRRAFAKIAGRIRVRPAIVVCVGVWLGYFTGLVMFLLRELASRDNGHWLPVNPYAADLFFKRYPFLDPRDSYMVDYPDLWIPWTMDWIAIAVVIGVFALAGLWLGRRAPLVLLPMYANNAPRSSLTQLRTIWRDALRASKPSSLFLISTGFLIGLTGAWIGELSASILFHFRSEAAWARGAPGTAKRPTPLFLWFALSDGLWVLGGAFLLTMLSIVMPARRRLIRTGELARRFCLSCGYPRPEPSPDGPHAEPTTPARNACPECGKPYVDPVTASPT